MIAHDIIRRPLITEKTSIQKESANQVTFEVDRGANRIEIKKAVEKCIRMAMKPQTDIQRGMSLD